jgi:ribosomal-protein-alanine N-acetyltransferase
MSAVLNSPFPVIRKMTKHDLDAVLAVEQRAHTHPWTEGILRDCLRVRYSCWVCECGDAVVGHAVMSFAVGEAHLLNLCVDPDLQRQGIGRRLLHRVMRVARERQADTLFLEVRASNFPARALYESEGFAEIGERRGYYPAHGGREDALLFARSLI